MRCVMAEEESVSLVMPYHPKMPLQALLLAGFP